MPAGKMFLVAKARKPRRASNFKKAVSKIAKGVVLRQTETRTADYSMISNLGTNGTYFSMWRNITQGDAQNNRDGDRIRSLGMRLRGWLTINPLIVTAYADGVSVRMLVVSSKRPLTSLADTGLTYNNAVDPELLTVLSDRYVQYSTDKRCIWLNKYFKFNRIVQYNPTGADPSKNELYVILIPEAAIAGSGITTTTGLNWNVRSQLYFKDP